MLWWGSKWLYCLATLPVFVMLISNAYRSIPPERLKQITNLLESDIIIRCAIFHPAMIDSAVFEMCSVRLPPLCRSIHDVKATDMGADSVRFKAEVNFDGREVARMHVDKLDLEKVTKVVLLVR